MIICQYIDSKIIQIKTNQKHKSTLIKMETTTHNGEINPRSLMLSPFRYIHSMTLENIRFDVDTVKSNAFF